MIDDYGRSYLRLTLEVNKHIDGYVDAYIGPAEIKAEVEAGPKLAPAALLAECERLQTAVPTADPARAAWLTAHLRGIDCSIRQLNGETFAFLDEANRLYDIEPHLIEESRFTEAAKELDTLLPGQGPIQERLDAQRKGYELPKEKILPLLELAREETRKRTLAWLSLPAEEGVEVRLVDQQPWGAYNWYLGNGRSLIEFNTDMPIAATYLLGTFAHEGYPGHHTEGCLKEKLLYQDKGYAEQAAMLLNSPAGVIAEAIATTAVEIIFPNDSDQAWNFEVMFPAAGITPTSTMEEMIRRNKATGVLRYVTGNASILYHTGQLNREQTIEYIQTYALSTPERAAKSFSFLSHPLYRSYVFTYTWGYDLIAQATKGQDKRPLFQRLLTEQLLPSQLAAMAKES